MIMLKLLNVMSSVFTICYCQSPCPGFFRYMINKSHEVYGRIEIPNPPRNVALHLRVSFSVATALPTNYVGKLELARSRSDSIKAIDQGLPLIYNAFFPISRPIPQLTEIKFNNRQFCIGQQIISPIVTKMFLEHYLYPPGVHPISNEPQDIEPSSSLFTTESSNFFSSIDRNIFTFNIISPITSQPLPSSSTSSPRTNVFWPLGESNYRENCGKTGEPINLSIVKKEKSWQGQWPWLVAIFIAQNNFKFQCAGSIITDRHVLTAAHCRRVNGKELLANNLLISAGCYRLSNWQQEDTQNLQVAEIRVHPEYKNQDSANADLALLIVRDKLLMNSIVQPLCLWSGPTNLETIVGHPGYIVGWGRDESGSQYLAEPRVRQVPIVSQEDCLRSNIGFITSTSNKTFCAGRRDDTGPCNGDSGSALVILNPLSGRYYLRGVVSLSLLDRDTLSCDLSQYVVYVDAAKYVDWIETQISNT